MTKKQQLYAEIAARHTPAGVRVVTLARGARASEAKAYGMAHRWPEDEEDDFVPWMEVPEPATIRRLWTYLHEACTCIRRFRRSSKVTTIRVPRRRPNWEPSGS